MVPHVPAVQLKEQMVVQNKTLIFGAAMRTTTTKQTLIPTTTRLDIVHANQRLWAHRNASELILLLGDGFASRSPR